MFGSREIAIVSLLVASATALPDFQRSTTTPAGCVWLILVDDLHLDFPATGRLKELLKTASATLVNEHDLVGAVSTGSSSIAIDLSEGSARLGRAIQRMSGAGLKPSETVGVPGHVVFTYKPDRDPRVIVDSSHDYSSEVRYRAHVALATAYGVLKMFAAVPNPHKAIIYISNGYYFDVWPGSRTSGTNPFSSVEKTVTLEHLRDEVAELTMEAKRGRVTIYGIDPRALSGEPTRDPALDDAEWQKYWMTTKNSLRVIAEQTRGFVIEDDLEGGLKRIAAELRP